MRRTLFIALLLVTSPAWSAVTFVTPQSGAQVFGPQLIEIRTDAIGVDRVEFRVDGVLVGVARTAPYRVAHDFGTNVAARRITATVLADRYRKSESADLLTEALTAGESISVDLVEVPLRVRSSRPPKPADIRVRENSIDQNIREIQRARGPAHFAFVVDRSLSMKGGKLEAALAAVETAKGLLRPDDTSSLVVFNHHVSQGRSASRLTASGGTALRDAVASTITDSAKRTYVIVITDGGDRNSVLSDEDALRRISGTRSIVSAVALGSPGTFLRRATATTGGSLLTATKADVGQRVREIVADINSRYTLVYQSRGNRAGWRSISIGSRRSDVEIISARKGYFAE